MEFHEKLQELRKRKGITQEELAQSLFVSRAAVSKWESGRGYPNIDSLKALACFYSITIDELLSGDELLSLAEEDRMQTRNCMQNSVFGLLDLGGVLFLLLPFFGQHSGEAAQAVSLPALTGISPYLKVLYCIAVGVTIFVGIVILAGRETTFDFWNRRKLSVSLFVNGCSALLFILSNQPYAAAMLFLFFTIKGILLVKTR